MLLALVLLFLAMTCANGQSTSDTTNVASIFLAQNAANAQRAASLLAQLRDQSVSVADKLLAVQVGIQQVRLPLIEQFKKAANDPALAVTPGSSSSSGNSNSNGTSSACVQKTQEEALQELAKIPWGKTVEEYRVLCSRNPESDILCFEKLRNLKFEDYQALLQAKEQGIKLNLPCVPKEKGGDYVVGDPFNVTTSGLPRQLQGALKLKALQEKLSKLAALTATTTAQATEATTTTASTTTTTVSTNPGDTTVSTAATTTTRTTTTAAPTTTAAARPTIRRVNGLLQVPPGQPNAGRTIYFFPGETSNAQQCTGGCADIWIPLNGERVADWALDPAAQCAGSSGNTLGAVPSSAAVSGVQLTCGNRLLYLFTDDRNPGDSRGLQFNGLPFRLA